jgi:ABC-2 type transport system ATP-binding protein
MDTAVRRNMTCQTIISVKGVKKAFGEVQALKGVDLELQSGKVLGLLGPNGSGKTTLIRIMATLLKADEGEVNIAGFDVVRNAQAVRSVIGLTGQYAAVDEELTGQENLHMIGRLYHLDRDTVRRRAREILERFALTQDAHRTVKTYSGGMRRRLDVAASLLMKPTLLFLDEPTTGLDLRSRIELWNIIRELLADGTTVLLTTQYLEEADQLADTICVINTGEIVARGTADQLKTQSGGDVLQITVADHSRLEQVCQLITPLSKREPQVEPVLGQINLPVNNGMRVLVEAIRALDEHNIEIVDIALRRPTLDDVFLALTGQKVGEEKSTSGNE